MDSGRFGRILENRPTVESVITDNSILKSYIDSEKDYIDSSEPGFKKFKNFGLFYNGIVSYATRFGIKPRELSSGDAIGYRINYNNVIIAIGINTNGNYCIGQLLDYDYDTCIDFDDIIKYYGGESKQVSKYLHLNKRAV